MISDAVLIAAITGFVSTIASGLAAWVSIRNGKKNDITNARVEKIHIEAVRSREDIDLMKTGAFRKGVIEGERRGSKSDLGTLE